MLRDKTGSRLFKSVNIKIYFPDKIFPDKKLAQRAPPKKGFSSENIDDILMEVADRLETLYPWWEFKMMELAPTGRAANFIFTFAGYRAGSFPAAKPEDYTPAPEEKKDDSGIPQD